MRDVDERLLDMVEAIERIEKYASEGRKSFEQNELIQTWVVHHPEIIGETASKLGRAFHEAHPVIPWAQIIAMRNILIHEYFGMDLGAVWNTIERDLPELKAKLKTIIKK
ncbi:MAG: DUF86 domain-containing protein [Syntrophorhabdus sp.]